MEGMIIMAVIQQILECRIDPSKPAQEICAIISEMVMYHPGQEAKILCAVQDAISKQLEEIATKEERRSKSEGPA